MVEYCIIYIPVLRTLFRALGIWSFGAKAPENLEKGAYSQ